jgi:uroporphyrinogen III methyltransferase/synthase
MIAPGVYLVGAGPGDPDLITVRGLEYLRGADVIVHDDLVSPRLLSHARVGAEIIAAGTAAPPPMAQEALGYLLADKAREHKVVVRLKWGDPFVFDSGGEEALYLRAQGVRVEVVPGLPAGIAVPAYAGVPVTYHGGGETLTLVRGYEDESRMPPDLDWASLVRLNGTIVCYAGAQQLPRILDALRAKGLGEDERAALVYNGTLATQETIEGSLADLALHVRERPRRAPAILIVGRVVGFREYLRWFDARPLFGRRVLVTRAREQAGELIERLAALGADPIEAPMIQIVPPLDAEPLHRAAAAADQFDWIVFSSTNAVDAFMRALLDGERDVRALKGPRLCAVGTATAGRLSMYGIKVDLVPDEFRAEALVEALLQSGPINGARILIPHADIARDVLANELRQAGAVVTEVVAYRTVLDESPREDEGADIYRMLLDGRIDVVTFTSASAVRNFATLFGADQAADLLRQTLVATIGPVTATAVAALGVEVAVQPSTYTVPALVEAIAARFQEPMAPARSTEL